MHFFDVSGSKADYLDMTYHGANVILDDACVSFLGSSLSLCALPKPVAVAVHFEDVDVVGESIQQGSCEPF